MLKVLILICPMSVDHASCTADTALDVIRSVSVASAQQCGFMSQAMLAQTTLVPDPAKQYAKILCVRDHASIAARS